MAVPQHLVAGRRILAAAQVAAQAGYEANGLAKQYGRIDAVFFA